MLEDADGETGLWDSGSERASTETDAPDWGTGLRYMACERWALLGGAVDGTGLRDTGWERSSMEINASGWGTGLRDIGWDVLVAFGESTGVWYSGSK